VRYVKLEAQGKKTPTSKGIEEKNKKRKRKTCRKKSNGEKATAVSIMPCKDNIQLQPPAHLAIDCGVRHPYLLDSCSLAQRCTVVVKASDKT
jgi:hypothetical protein